ncbi:Wzz/FepE/Etk N-terminal domain-containing protein [Cupriavidus pauculus]|uniref:Polysaccharide chain length determinant N-terminal domain-containing protein n=1 Tax=Cupriavidus pauculus TaxID=82633 RepID=A0A2N5CH74_9BURK|nr:Wzz/FepE/Etk N-terminal domain-containing protein [Cupriavidus pauculus]PLQ01554.1 hypothetical protein CYJ10_07725 [Cupriavidus pauculus]
MTEIARDPENAAAVTPSELLKRSWKLIVLLGALGALGGATAAMVIKPRWVAKVTVQVGQLSAATNLGGINSRLIENQLTVADRFNAPAARLQVLRTMGYPTPASHRDAQLYFDTMRAGTGRSPDTVNLQVSGYSRDGAVSAMSASFKVLAATHNLLSEPTISRIKSELDGINDKLTATQQEYDKSLQALKTGATKSSSSAQDILATNLVTVLNAQILDLRKQAALAQESLEPARTYPTRMLGEPYAPDEPSTPGPALLTIAGAALGMVIGALIGFLRRQRS